MNWIVELDRLIESKHRTRKEARKRATWLNARRIHGHTGRAVARKFSDYKPPSQQPGVPTWVRKRLPAEE